MPKLQPCPQLALDETEEKPYTVIINNDGTLSAVHDDSFEWEAVLGGYEISRASKREFNNTTKMWEATINGVVIAQHKNKEMCDKLECQYLEKTNLQYRDSETKNN